MVSATPPPTLEELFEAGRGYDATFLPELAAPLIERYGLQMPAGGAWIRDGRLD